MCSNVLLISFVLSDLSFDLHAADRAAGPLSRPDPARRARRVFPRFLTLLIVGNSGSTTQRALAEALGVSEPSVSRMTGVLAETGLLDASRIPAAATGGA